LRERLAQVRHARRTLRTVAAAVGVAVVIAAVVLLGRSGAPPVFGQSFVIGFVDMQRALDAHPRKAASERALQEFFQAKQREFAQRARGLTPEQRQQLDRQLQQQIIQKRQELLGGLDRDLRAAVEQVARAENVSIVLERSVVLFGGVDLTDQVIKRLTGK
jgi:outer membrane protein